jgi:threonyl-tRNA synthetase
VWWPVVGETEQTGGTVNVRTRDNVVHGVVSVAEAIARLDRNRKQHLRTEEFSAA